MQAKMIVRRLEQAKCASLAILSHKNIVATSKKIIGRKAKQSATHMSPTPNPISEARLETYSFRTSLQIVQRSLELLQPFVRTLRSNICSLTVCSRRRHHFSPPLGRLSMYRPAGYRVTIAWSSFTSFFFKMSEINVAGASAFCWIFC